jgi:hypothetical protein
MIKIANFQIMLGAILLVLMGWYNTASTQGSLKVKSYNWLAKSVKKVDTEGLLPAIPHTVIVPSSECILGSTQPLFPGCPEIAKYEAREKCAERLLSQYFADHFEYDMQSCDHSGISYVILSFDVSKLGAISNIHVVRRRGCDFEDAAIAALSKMKEEDVVWEPATVDRTAVKGRSAFMAKIHIE